jgi:uncharacterized membrane protein
MKRVTVAGHSLHPMLVVFPLGLLATSLVWDLVHLASSEGNTMWAMISFWTIVAGVVGGVLAAIPGLLDFLAIPAGTRAKKVGAIHGLLNLGIILLFLVSIALRVSGGYLYPSVMDMLPGWIAIAMALVAAWLGGELVERLGIGVSNFQDVNAPSSLREARDDQARPPTAPNLKATTRFEGYPPRV